MNIIEKPCKDCARPTRAFDDPTFTDDWLCYYCHCLRENIDQREALNTLAEMFKVGEHVQGPDLHVVLYAIRARAQYLEKAGWSPAVVQTVRNVAYWLDSAVGHHALMRDIFDAAQKARSVGHEDGVRSYGEKVRELIASSIAFATHSESKNAAPTSVPFLRWMKAVKGFR